MEEIKFGNEKAISVSFQGFTSKDKNQLLEFYERLESIRLSCDSKEALEFITKNMTVTRIVVDVFQDEEKKQKSIDINLLKRKVYTINVDHYGKFDNNAFLDVIKAFSHKSAVKKATRKYGKNIRVSKGKRY